MRDAGLWASSSANCQSGDSIADSGTIVDADILRYLRSDLLPLLMRRPFLRLLELLIKLVIIGVRFRAPVFWRRLRARLANSLADWRSPDMPMDSCRASRHW